MCHRRLIFRPRGDTMVHRTICSVRYVMLSSKSKFFLLLNIPYGWVWVGIGCRRRSFFKCRPIVAYWLFGWLRKVETISEITRTTRWPNFPLLLQPQFSPQSSVDQFGLSGGPSAGQNPNASPFFFDLAWSRSWSPWWLYACYRGQY